MDTQNVLQGAGALGGIGAMIGLGQMLLTPEKLTWRRVIGRAICSGGLGLSAAGALTIFPDMSVITLAGVAAALASVGTSGLERLAKRWIDKQ